ncbi:MAG TPA: regulatory protein RecX [Vicinamibacterales bacterium]
MNPPDPYTLSLKWLGLRELSERQIRQRLAARQVSVKDIDDAVRALKSNGALDDRRTAVAAARTDALVKRHGRRRVTQHLLALGIGRELARQVVENVFADIDEQALLERALARRLGRTRRAIKDAAEHRRLYAYLVRQGFEPSAVASLLRHRSRSVALADD